MNGQTMCRKCQRRIKVHNVMRNLWEHHIFWTYNFINSMVQNLPDAKYARQRLLQNPEDFERELYRIIKIRLESVCNSLRTPGSGCRHVECYSVRQSRGGQTERQWYQNAEDIARSCLR